MRDRHLTMRWEGKTYFVHRWIWELCNFKPPKGFMIHHIDDDVFNNMPENLELVGRKEHGAKHKVLNSSHNP